MIVDLHELDDGSFALVRRFKFGNVEIRIDVTSGNHAMTNVDVINFRLAVEAVTNIVPVVEP